MDDLMHSLAFALRHAEDFYGLVDLKDQKPSSVTDEDWSAFQEVASRADEQRRRILVETVDVFQTLSRGVRFERVTRERRLALSWEAWGRVFPARRRTAIGLLGASIAIERTNPTRLHIWWGYDGARGIRGAQLVERLRPRHPGVRLGRPEHGWMKGTVALAELGLAAPSTVAACVASAKEAVRILEAECDELLAI